MIHPATREHRCSRPTQGSQQLAGTTETYIQAQAGSWMAPYGVGLNVTLLRRLPRQAP
jgi:hypothetical protein